MRSVSLGRNLKRSQTTPKLAEAKRALSCRIDHHDLLAAAHAHQVVAGARDADSHIELGRTVLPV